MFVITKFHYTLIFLQENGRSYLRHEQNAKQGVGSVRESEIGPGGALSQFLFESGSLLNDLASSQVTYEIGKMTRHFFKDLVWLANNIDT